MASNPMELRPGSKPYSVERIAHPRRARWLGFAANAAGAAFALYLLRPNLEFFLRTGRLVVLVFMIQQAWGGRRVSDQACTSDDKQTAARLDRSLRRLVHLLSHQARRLPANARSAYRILDSDRWPAALGVGLLQVGSILRCRPADRGLVTAGPYGVVRHPLYTAYIVGGLGYLIQSLSVWNVGIDLIAVGWQLVRIRAEERHLAGRAYEAYRARVPWRLCPGLW
jgi:hypothetical protein